MKGKYLGRSSFSERALAVFNTHKNSFPHPNPDPSYYYRTDTGCAELIFLPMIMSRALHKRQASRYLSIYKSCYLDIGSHQAPVGLQKIDGSVCQNKRRTELSNALYVPAMHEWLITEKCIINLYRMTTKALVLKE